MRQDRERRTWIFTSQGAQILGEKEEPIFSDEQISFMLQDKEGNYWFTSLHNGIFLVPNLETEVKLLLPVAHKPYAFTYFN